MSAPAIAGAPRQTEALAPAAVQVAQLAADVGQSELAERLRAAAARATRTSTIVCVVGEFKQGKSSLINALVGANVCPVDDDLATATLTLLAYGDEPSARVRRREADRTLVEPVPLERIGDVVTEAGNPGNEKRLERVEILLPSPLLRDGVALVDTPGMGGLSAGQAAATLAFLPYADALIFVSDASSELSAPELDFVTTARERCPTVVFALTKIDIAPAWRQIAEIDRAHLARRGLDVDVFPVSATLLEAARKVNSSELARESGVGKLLNKMRTTVVEPARANAARRAAEEASAAIDQLTASLRAEVEVLEDPTRLEAMLRNVEAARGKLEHLRGPGARWSTVLADRMTDLTNDVGHALRATLRTLGRDYDERVDALKTPAEWSELGRSLSTDVSDAVAGVFAKVSERSRQVRQEVADILRADSLDIGDDGPARLGIDIAALWSGPRFDDEAGRAKQALGGALTSLRGAQSGIMLLGLVGSLLPAALGAIVLSAPITLGLGAAFAGSQLLDANKRKLAQRRQKVKTAIRQFMDDVQFQVTNELGEQVRLTQRDLRDDFTSAVSELTQALTETARRAQEDATREQSTREQRIRDNAARIARLAELRAVLQEAAA